MSRDLSAMERKRQTGGFTDKARQVNSFIIIFLESCRHLKLVSNLGWFERVGLEESLQPEERFL
jgi:hypothetical protein